MNVEEMEPAVGTIDVGDTVSDDEGAAISYPGVLIHSRQ